MATWNGYRTSRAGCGGGLNGFYAPKATQAWAIGLRVNVGFLKDLLITNKAEGVWRLVNERNGRWYEFQPHVGLSAMEG